MRGTIVISLWALLAASAMAAACNAIAGLDDIQFQDGAGPAGGQGGTGVGAGGTGGSGGQVETVLVEPVYPNNKDWNDYVRFIAALNEDEYHQGDVSCDGNESGGHDLCIHGGEKRKVALTGQTLCDGLTILDDRGAFSWVCDDQGGTGPVTFYTQGLAPGVGLGHLMDSTGFLTNAVTVTRDGQTVARSEAAVWNWANEVLPLPDNASGPVELLAATGAIYFGDTSRASNGYAIDADKVALVLAPNVTITYGGDAAFNCSQQGEITGALRRCQVTAGHERFLWIEGRFDADAVASADDAEHNLVLATVRFARVHRFFALNSMRAGIELYHGAVGNRFTSTTASGSLEEGIAVRWENCHYNTFEDVLVEGTGESGFLLPASNYGHHYRLLNVRAVACGSGTHTGIVVDSDHCELRGVVAHANQDTGIDLKGPDNTLVGAVVSNNASDGLVLSGAAEGANVTAVGVLSVGNGSDGINVDGANQATVSHVTAVNHCGRGSFMNYGAAPLVGLTMNQALVVNSVNHGLEFSGPTGSGNGLFSQIAALHSATTNVELAMPGNRFTGHLYVSDATGNCGVGGLLDAGLIESTCTDTGQEGSSTYTGQQSDAVLHINLSVAASFVGPVVTDDPVNSSDDNGAQTMTAITDWSGFDNLHRAWGIDGAAFPGATDCGDCTAGTCRIWDWRLRASDTVLRNINGVFTAGDSCPSSVHGDVAVTDQQDPANTFLVNATEIVADRLGDDDGLCESGEACIYSPNIGVYQGEGDYRSSTCTFQDGLVDHVTMYGHPENGG